MKKNITLIICSALLLMTSQRSLAQTADHSPYYLSMNTATPNRIHDISDGKLNLEYHDSYGQWKLIPVKILDWQQQEVATLEMDKSYGMNNVTVTLKDIYNKWEVNKIYTCVIRDERGKKYELPFRLVPPPHKEDPLVSVLVSPVRMKCSQRLRSSSNLVEFYAKIKGGKAPYTVNWYVMNETKTEFLYQPREEQIKKAGKTSVVRVDKDPGYYVVLHVKDACGGEQKQVVNIMCRNNRKRVNSVFIEQFKSPLLDKKSIK